MSNGYESLDFKRTSVSEILQILKGLSSGNKSAQGQLTQNQAHTNFNDSVSALVTTIENAANPNDLINSGMLANDLTSAVSSGNVEGVVKLSQANQSLSNTTQDYVNYKGAIDGGYNLLNKWVMPKKSTPISGLPGDVDVLSQPGDIPTFTQTIDTGEELMDVASDLYTIDNINSALDEINNFESSLYTDPMKKDKEVKFINHYPLKNEAGETIGKDVDIINRLLGEGGLKDKLLTSLAALEDDDLITNNEIYYIVTGNKEGLENARTENITTSKANLISYRRSSNSIRSYQKQILNAIAKGQIDKEGKAIDIFNATLLFENLTVNELDFNNPLYAGMDEEDIKASKLSEYEGMSIGDVMAKWDNELIKYHLMSQKENKRFKLWANQNFEFSDPTVDDIVAEKIRRSLAK